MVAVCTLCHQWDGALKAVGWDATSRWMVLEVSRAVGYPAGVAELCDVGTCLICPHKPSLMSLVARRVRSEAVDGKGGIGRKFILYLE